MINIRGTVMRGLGKGEGYVKIYATRIEAITGFRPYPGTLNLRVDKPVPTEGWETVEPFDAYGRIYLRKANLFGYRLYAMVPERTSHQNVIELIAPFNIKWTLKVKDGDRITIALI